MKFHPLSLEATVLLSACCAMAQGTFIYDQQSSDESRYLEGGVGLGQQPLGQSFTPGLSSVGFIRLYIYDALPGVNSGLLAVNLRSDSVTGVTLGTAVPVALTDGFAGTVDFLFPSPITVLPGNVYYFQPVVQSGGGWGTLVSSYNYSGGTAFIDGTAVPGWDLWFREGLVPEPSSAILMIAGMALFIFVRRRREVY